MELKLAEIKVFRILTMIFHSSILTPINPTRGIVGRMGVEIIGAIVVETLSLDIRLTQRLKTAWAVVTKAVFQSFPLDELGEQKVPLGNCATP